MTQDERAELDIPNHKYQLTLRGLKEGELAGQYLKGLIELQGKYRVVRAYQSTFVRTQNTLTLILDQLGLKITPITDSRLDEKWDGIFHDLSKKEVGERYPDQVRLRKRSGYYHYRAPGGESCPDVELRIRSFVDSELLQKDNGSQDHASDLGWNSGSKSCDLIVCHGRWFQLYQKYLRGLSVDEFLEIKEKSEYPNCSITIYNTAGKTIVDNVNPWEGILAKDESTFA